MNASRDHSTVLGGKGLLPFYWRSLIQPNLFAAAVITAVMLGSSLFQMGTIALVVPLLEAVAAGGSQAPSRVLDVFRNALRALGFTASDEAVLLAVMIFASLLFTLHSALLLFQQYQSHAVAERLRRDIKFRLFERFLYSRFGEIADRGRGAILQDLTGPPNAVYTAIIRLSTLFTAVFNVAALLVFMVYLSWWATFVVGAIGLSGIFATRRILDRRSDSAGRAIYSLQSDETKLAVDAIDGLKILKSHAAELTMIGRFKMLLDAEVRPSLRVALYRYLPQFLNEFAAGVIVIVFASIALFRPSWGLSFPILVGFLMAIRQCGAAIASVNSNIVELQSLRQSIEIVGEIVSSRGEPSGARSVANVGEIVLRDVSVQFRSDSPALDGVNLSLRKGTVTALVGPTGAGKSTVVNLIAGLISPAAGSVLIDGRDLREFDLTQWRGKIGYVSQDVFLFNTTIRENIAMWRNGFTAKDIERASKLAQLHEFVSELPEGYDTVVGDRGLKLSGGQCQRISIARAILARPEVLLLDEATSALDNLTERAVYEAMDALRGNAIVVAVAHRLSTVKSADAIVVFESGRVVESGTHDDLMTGRGPYSRLFHTEFVH